MKLSDVKNGNTFKIGDIEFIKFSDDNGKTKVVTKECVFISFFGNSNNFATSEILKRLENEFLPKIANVIGEENINEFETNLLTLDGMTNYGVMSSKVSLPTFDFYRKNRPIFDKYRINEWWWLSTANGNSWFVSCVSPSGDISFNCGSCDDIGVRPFCILNSNIFVSN